MVLGYHIIFNAYGFWLPNDPRGSWSQWVAAWELFRYGPATKVDTRRSVASKPHDWTQREETKKSLHFPPVSFTGLQAQKIGNAFASLVEKSGIQVWACAILPEHVHMVLGRHRYKAEQMVNLFKGEATRFLVEAKVHPFLPWQKVGKRVPMCWGRKLWKVFLDEEEDILRSIAYVEQNPAKEGKPRQRWSFVSPFVRSPRSPVGSG
jgi:REP element-mobilizing transposase RayT